MLNKVPDRLVPGCDLHDWLYHVNNKPDHRLYNLRKPQDRHQQRAFFETCTKHVAYRANLANLNYIEVKERDRIVEVRFGLSHLGVQALEGLNRSEVWVMGAQRVNHVHTRHYWLDKLSRISISLDDAAHMQRLPRPEYDEIHRALTYYLMKSTRRDRRWVREEALDSDVMIDHQLPGSTSVPRLSDLMVGQ